jgi:aminopeptidase N
MDNESVMTISILIEWKNEENFIKGLREYFRQSKEQGQSDEEFLKWVEGNMK